MRRKLIAMLMILIGEPIPHEWTVCPNYQWIWTTPYQGTDSPQQPHIYYNTVTTSPYEVGNS